MRLIIVCWQTLVCRWSKGTGTIAWTMPGQVMGLCIVCRLLAKPGLSLA
ncbi:hypothetical protein ACLHZ0_11075 [Aeromonas salmonicida]|nr:hypothetical protein [Aeromonas salmonicida]